MMLKFPIADRWDVVCSVNFLFGFVCLFVCAIANYQGAIVFFFFNFFYFIYFFIVTVSVIKRYNDHPHTPFHY